MVVIYLMSSLNISILLILALEAAAEKASDHSSSVKDHSNDEENISSGYEDVEYYLTNGSKYFGGAFLQR